MVDFSPIKSAARTVRLFEVFAAVQRPLTVLELAAEMAIPQPSATVLVKTFVSLGYLDRVPGTRRYYPTLRVMLMSAWMHRRHSAVALLPAALERVSQVTGETVVLAIRNSIFSQYVIANLSRRAERFNIDSGVLYPLACCATGWCFLAELDDAEVSRIVRRTQIEAGSLHWRKSARDAFAKVEEFRRQGYVMSDGQTEPGLGALAITLPRKEGSFALAAGVGGHISRIGKKKDIILEQLHALSDHYAALMDDPALGSLPIL